MPSGRRWSRKAADNAEGTGAKLVERWPSWFNIHGDVRHTLMRFGFQHGDGWFDLLWRLCEDLEPLVAQAEKQTGKSFEVLQVKEKFGGLRFYVSQKTDAIRQRINAAGLESIHTCEVCGQPGVRRGGGWMTLCEEHAEGREVYRNGTGDEQTP
jgi:hypothetical protein